MSSVHSVRHQVPSGLQGDSRCLVFGVEETEIHSLIGMANSSAPLAIPTEPVNPTVLRHTAEHGQVLHVLWPRHSAQVTPSIVQFVPIDVIRHQIVIGGKAEYFSMHANRAVRATSQSVPVDIKMPSELLNDANVRSINNCVPANGVLLAHQGYEVRIAGGRYGRKRTSYAIDGAVFTVTTPDLRLFSEESKVASLAHTKHGTLVRHRTLQRSGARPVTARTVRGPLAFNCTRLGVM